MLTISDHSEHLMAVEYDGWWIGTIVKPIRSDYFVILDNHGNRINHMNYGLLHKQAAADDIFSYYMSVCNGTDQERAARLNKGWPAEIVF